LELAIEKAMIWTVKIGEKGPVAKVGSRAESKMQEKKTNCSSGNQW
jgi:hypothetical protein